MAGHSKFKNIQYRKESQDKRRAKIFTKIIREIISAIKASGNDPERNTRLRNAIISAKSINLPKEKIDKLLNQEKDNKESYSEITYEGFVFDGIGIIIETLTDNRNRSASEIRSIFNKHGGRLVESGSVNFMFDKVGIIEYSLSFPEDQVIEASIEAGAIDIESENSIYTIYSEIENFHSIISNLEKKFNLAQELYIGWKAKEYIIIEDKDKAEKIIKLVNLLENNDDVQRVFGNYIITDEIYKLLTNL